MDRAAVAGTLIGKLYSFRLLPMQCILRKLMHLTLLFIVASWIFYRQCGKKEYVGTWVMWNSKMADRCRENGVTNVSCQRVIKMREIMRSMSVRSVSGNTTLKRTKVPMASDEVGTSHCGSGGVDVLARVR